MPLADTGLYSISNGYGAISFRKETRILPTCPDLGYVTRFHRSGWFLMVHGRINGCNRVVPRPDLTDTANTLQFDRPFFFRRWTLRRQELSFGIFVIQFISLDMRRWSCRILQECHFYLL